MSKNYEYDLGIRPSKIEKVTVKLSKEFHELMLEMTLAYLADQPPDEIDFALQFLNEKKMEKLGVFKPLVQSRMMHKITPTSRRYSVLSEPVKLDDDFHHMSFFKTDAQKDKLVEAIDSSMFFQSLGQYERKVVIDAMRMRNVSKGEIVIKQGAQGNHFYVVEKGVFVAVEDRNGETKTLKVYNNDGYFGELALLYNIPRACSVVAKTDGILWALDRPMFRRAIVMCSYQKRKMHEMLIDNVAMLSVLSDVERSNLADALVSKCYENGECIIQEGDDADGMYFIESGIAEVVRRRPGGKQCVIKRLASGDYFGELALITLKKRAASVFACGPVKVAFLCVEAFERLLGRCIDVMKRNISHYEKQMENLEQCKIDINELR